MSGFSIVLFFHIVGAMGLFVALGLEWTGLWQIRSAARPDQVRTWLGILKSGRGVGFASMLTTVISGLYMMATAVGGAPWLLVTIGALALVIALSVVLSGPRMAALGRALMSGTGALPPDFASLANHPLLWISILTRAAIALGIVLLKVSRPDLGGSLLVIGAAIVLGLAAALPVTRGAHAQESAG